MCVSDSLLVKATTFNTQPIANFAPVTNVRINFTWRNC